MLPVFSGVRVAHLLFVYVWSLSLYYILLITAITLVPLITLSGPLVFFQALSGPKYK